MTGSIPVVVELDSSASRDLIFDRIAQACSMDPARVRNFDALQDWLRWEAPPQIVIRIVGTKLGEASDDIRMLMRVVESAVEEASPGDGGIELEIA